MSEIVEALMSRLQSVLLWDGATWTIIKFTIFSGMGFEDDTVQVVVRSSWGVAEVWSGDEFMERSKNGDGKI